MPLSRNALSPVGILVTISRSYARSSIFNTSIIFCLTPFHLNAQSQRYALIPPETEQSGQLFQTLVKGKF